MIKNNLLELLVDFFLFAEYYVTLTFDSLWFKFRILQNVGKNVDRRWDVRVE